MISVLALEPAFLEYLRKELPLVDLMPDTIPFPHVERRFEGSLRVRVIGPFRYPILDFAKRDFVF